MRNNLTKKDFLFFSLLAGVLVFVFFDLFTLSKAFLSGDHWEQQYPWSFFYQSQIRQFLLPWWTSLIQCGFPILAEGQIGALYPINTLFLFFLPIKWAYNYELLFHYALGVSLFYYYMRRIRVSEWGSFFAALIFLLGSTQGGYFYYNYISQKVVVWLPLTLILIDRLVEKEEFKDAFWLSLVFTLEVFAGYLQIAIYSIFFSSVYFLYFWFFKRSWKLFSLFTIAGILSIFFSLIQLLPTYELAQFSSRALAGKELAYVGSMLPIGFLTLFYPSWDAFLQSEFYVGIVGLFFVSVSIFTKKESKEKFFFFAAIFFLLLALGQFSPLYRGIVELTHFQGFRNPIKFLFFVTFSCAILAGFGFDKIFSKNIFPKKTIAWFFGIGAVMFFIPVVLGGFLTNARSSFVPFFQNLIEKFFFGKAGHPHSLEAYRDKAVQYYDAVAQGVSLSQKETLIEWGILVSSLIILGSLLFSIYKQKGKTQNWIKGVLVGLLFLDLYLYGFTSIQTGLEPFDTISPKMNESEIVKYLQKDSSKFRTMEIFTQSNETRKFPVFPSNNMLSGIDDIGIYTPLVMRRYKDLLGDFGYVNDSISFQWVNPRSVTERLKTLSYMNVKYILSVQPVEHADLKFIMKENDVYLYENKKVVSRAFFVPGFQGELKSFDQISNWKEVPITKYQNQRVELDFQADTAGLLVLSDTFYPKWIAEDNGQETPIMRGAEHFRVISLQPGKHHVVFSYKPLLYQWLGLGALVLILVISLQFIFRFRYTAFLSHKKGFIHS